MYCQPGFLARDFNEWGARLRAAGLQYAYHPQAFEFVPEVVLGAGQIGWVRFLRAAAKAGVKRYHIEDESPDAPKQIPLTLDYLGRLRF
jgi:sugar phosphate isomerase/epimerase